MNLIADSGSSETIWYVTAGNETKISVKTPGINPFYQTTGEIQELILTALLPKIHTYNIDKIYFYCSGCAFPEKKTIVFDALQFFFPTAVIEVESDLLAAARALFQHEKGIACILGTGSNSCFYDGIQIVQNVSPLGFILGDEGSGAVLGKQLIGDCLKNQLPLWLCNKLMDQYALTPEKILDAVYKNAFPNRFLASFAPFILEHLEEPVIFNMVYDGLDAFFTRNVMQYDIQDVRVGFVGSIAYYFKDTLEIVASERNIGIEKIIQQPIEGLVDFHAQV